IAMRPRVGRPALVPRRHSPARARHRRGARPEPERGELDSVGELVADLPATATSFQLPDDDAYYSIFVYDAVGNFSAPAHVNRFRRGQLTRKGPAALPRRGLACARLAAALSSPFLPLEGQRRTGAPGSRQPR